MNFQNKDFALVRNTSSFGHVNRPFPWLPFARPPFQREEDIFPVSRKREDVNIFSSFVPTFSSVWSLVFYSHALFVILFLHLLFVKLTKRVSNSSEKRWQLLCTLNLSSLSEWRPRTFSVYYVYLTSVKNAFICNQIKNFMSPPAHLRQSKGR